MVILYNQLELVDKNQSNLYTYNDIKYSEATLHTVFYFVMASLSCIWAINVNNCVMLITNLHFRFRAGPIYL